MVDLARRYLLSSPPPRCGPARCGPDIGGSKPRKTIGGRAARPRRRAHWEDHDDRENTRPDSVRTGDREPPRLPEGRRRDRRRRRGPRRRALVARAQTQTWNIQSGWPSGDIFHEFAQDFVNKVNEMSGGRLQMNLLPAGSVVGALELQDAITGGALDGAHGVSAYWYGKNKAASLFGTPPAFGWNANQFLGWMKYGGGQELYDELVQDILGLDLVGFLSGPMPTQALGWFRDPITTPDELSGLRYRTVGLAADLMEELGAAVTILGGPDIVPALDRGVIDAAEFNNPYSDRHLGFQDVAKHWMLQSFHQDAEAFEISFNRRATRRSTRTSGRSSRTPPRRPRPTCTGRRWRATRTRRSRSSRSTT
jgi:hypothetical protein